MEDVAEARDRLFVAVAEVEAEDLDAGAVGLHARGETTHVHVAVVALRARIRQRRIAEHRLRPTVRHRVVGAADAERPATAIREERAGVALAEIPAAIGTEGHRMQRVVVVAAVETGQQHVALVDRGIEPAVAVHVGVDDHVRRVRHDHAVVDHRDAQGRHQRRFLHEHARLVGASVVIRVFEHHDAIARMLATPVMHKVGANKASAARNQNASRLGHV